MEKEIIQEVSKLDQILAGAKFRLLKSHEKPYCYLIEDSGFGLEVNRYFSSTGNQTAHPYQGDVEKYRCDEHVLVTSFRRLGKTEYMDTPMSQVEIIED